MAIQIPSWVDNEFIERILRSAEIDPTINVVDIVAKTATGKCDNYLSDMARVVVDFTRKQNGKKINDKKSLMFKFEPVGDGLRHNIIRHGPFFDMEIAMMIKPLKKMNQLLESCLSPNIFYTRLEQPRCLIMEDLAPQGFRMADRRVGLDLTHSILAIQGLAKFHASSVAVCEKHPKYKSMFNKGFFYEDQSDMMMKYWIGVTMNFAAEIEGWPELGKSYADKLRNWAPEFRRKALEVMKCNENEFNVINHGDCWVNNMLFRYDENSKPIEEVFVDFQLSVYGSPGLDLNYFLATSVSEKVSLNNIADLYKEYLRTLTTTMKRLGCKTLPPTMEELKKSIKKRALYGLIASLGVLPLIVVDEDEAKDIDEVVLEDAILPHPGLKNPNYRRIMSRRMPEYVEMGLLDV